MKKNSTRRIVLNGLMIALVFLATYFTHIPTPLPGGYFNLGDAVIMVAAVILGRTGGLLAGGIGSCLADIAYGSFLFAPITLVVKALEGYIVGVTASENSLEKLQSSQKRLVAVVLGAVIMVSGYFLAEAFLLGLFDQAFGFVAATAELVPNLLQGGISAVVGYALSSLLIKLNVTKYI